MIRIGDIPSFGLVSEDVSSSGISGPHADVFADEDMGRPVSHGTAALCFSRDGQYLYHAYHVTSEISPNSALCRINIDIWNHRNPKPTRRSKRIDKVSLIQ